MGSTGLPKTAQLVPLSAAFGSRWIQAVMRKMEDSIELTDGTVTLRRYRAEDAEPIYPAVRESIEEISPKGMGVRPTQLTALQ